MPMPALLIVDMQKGIHQPHLGPRNNPHAEDQLEVLLSKWRGACAPLVHIRHISRSANSIFAPDQSGVEFQEQFLPFPHEPVFEKNVPDAFAHTKLERWLHQRNIGHVVIAGVITNNSIECTARSADHLGFTTWVASDACFTFDLHATSGVVYPADLVHSMALANLEQENVRALVTQEVISRIFNA
jgi:nicotinamidase-related amidase